jgi:hypothetical protein
MKTIPLTRGLEALVDDDDYENLIRFRWYAHRCPNQDYFYARCGIPFNGGTKQVLMHRMILGSTDPQIGVDHINCNSLDNRKANLRIADKKQNGSNTGKRRVNTSGYKGVSFHSASGKWLAQIVADKKWRYLGLHGTPELAHRAYCKAAEELHGEYARTI